MSFRGQYDHTLDNKGRISIPAGFRMEIQRLGREKPPILTRGKEHLILYPAEVIRFLSVDTSSLFSTQVLRDLCLRR